MLKQSAKLPSSLRLCAGALLGVLMVAPASAWEPSKPVEIVVAAGAGGASDQMARMLQAAVQKNNLMKQPLIVSLKGGASGAEGLMYMKQGEGDAHKFIIAYSLIYTLPLSVRLPFDWRTTGLGVATNESIVHTVGCCVGVRPIADTVKP